MKSRFFFGLVTFGIAIIILLAFYGFQSVKSGNDPEIIVEPEKYDFGEIRPETISHDFSVKNSGGSELKVTGISTSCGCTKATIEKNALLPGETTTLSVIFDPNSMEPAVRGEVLRAIYLITNDPDNREKTIFIEGKVTEK